MSALPHDVAGKLGASWLRHYRPLSVSTTTTIAILTAILERSSIGATLGHERMFLNLQGAVERYHKRVAQ